jgi:hypothetical protein
MITCEQIKSWMMDFMYEELSDQQKPLFEGHLHDCAACRAELAELQQTSAALAEWSEAEPAFSFAVPPGRISRWERLRENWLFPVPRWAAGFAMAAMLIFFLLAAFNTQVSNAGGHWEIRMSLHAQPAAPVLPEGSIILSRQDLLTLEQERWLAIQAYMQQSDLKQQREWSNALTQLARAVQTQRNQDMRLVSRGLVAMGEETAQRFQLTDQVLAEVIRFASADQNSRE